MTQLQSFLELRAQQRCRILQNRAWEMCLKWMEMIPSQQPSHHHLGHGLSTFSRSKAQAASQAFFLHQPAEHTLCGFVQWDVPEIRHLNEENLGAISNYLRSCREGMESSRMLSRSCCQCLHWISTASWQHQHASFVHAFVITWNIYIYIFYIYIDINIYIYIIYPMDSSKFSFEAS